MDKSMVTFFWLTVYINFVLSLFFRIFKISIVFILYVHSVLVLETISVILLQK